VDKRRTKRDKEKRKKPDRDLQPGSDCIKSPDGIGEPIQISSLETPQEPHWRDLAVDQCSDLLVVANRLKGALGRSTRSNEIRRGLQVPEACIRIGCFSRLRRSGRCNHLVLGTRFASSLLARLLSIRRSTKRLADQRWINLVALRSQFLDDLRSLQGRIARCEISHNLRGARRTLGSFFQNVSPNKVNGK
jgi:hypothetical protein